MTGAPPIKKKMGRPRKDPNDTAPRKPRKKKPAEEVQANRADEIAERILEASSRNPNQGPMREGQDTKPDPALAVEIANDDFFPLLFPRATRDIQTFAEQEVVLPKGPRRGTYFDPTFMPCMNFVFDAIMDPYWRKVAVVGPTQSGKSLVCNNIPMLYALFELREDVIVGIPDMELARGIWTEKIKPVIEATRYQALLPTTGSGARGGVPTSIELKNGVFLRFMGAGGGDAQRSSHTARIIIMTEIDKMDDIGEASEEADPVSQIEMRADAYADTSKILLECTVTTELGRIWQEAMVTGTGAKVHVPCPKCGAFQPLEPGGLVFDGQDVLTAEESARYRCCKCEAMWTDSERRNALLRPLLVHRGQEVVDGAVIGEIPRTRTFGLHYNVLYSPMQSLGKTAAQQWEADNSELKEKKKAMMQSKWAVPWHEEMVGTNVLSYSFLRQRALASEVEMKLVPEWYEFLIMEVDVQKRWLYWHVDAYRRDGTSQVVEYGVTDIVDDSDKSIRKALDQTFDIAQEGWPLQNAVEGEESVIQPRLCLLDTGYRYDIIAGWLKGRTGWFGVKGIGRGMKQKMTGSKSMFTIPGIVQIRMQDDGNKIWFVEVDNTKALVQDRYFLGQSQPGYTEVPKDVTQGYMMSLTAEKREYSGNNDDGFVWVKVRRRNDYLDCRSYGVAGAMYLAQKMKRDDAGLKAKVDANKKMEKGTADEEQKANFLVRPADEKKDSPPPAPKSPARRPPPPKRQSWFGTSGRYFS